MKKHLFLILLCAVCSTTMVFAQDPLYGETCEEAPYIATGYDQYLTAGTYWFRSYSYDFPFTITYSWDKNKHPGLLLDDEQPECVVDFSCVTGQYDDPTLYKVVQYAIDSLNREWPVVGHLGYDPENQNFFREFSRDYRTALYVFGITDNTPIYLKITLSVDGYLQFNSNSPHAQCVGKGEELQMNTTMRLNPSDPSDLYLWPIAEWAHTNYQIIWEPDNGIDDLYMIEGEWCNLDKDYPLTIGGDYFFMEDFDGVFLWNSNKALAETKEFGMSEEYVRFYPDGSGTLRIQKLPANVQNFILLDSTVFATVDREQRTVTAILPKGTDRNTAIQAAQVILEPNTDTYFYDEAYNHVTINDGLNTTYTLDISVVPYVANDDATLKEITVDGKPIEGFRPDVFEYTVNCEAVPVIAATATDPNRYSIDIKQPTDYTRYATIKVAAEDVYTTLTYTVNIILPKHTDATLSAIRANDKLIDDFSPDVFRYLYNVTDPSRIPALVGQANDRLASVSYPYVATKENLPDSTIILCTAEDGSTLKYTVVFDNLVSDDITGELYVNGNYIGPLNKTKRQYNGINIPSIPPTLNVVTTHPNATVSFEEFVSRSSGRAGGWNFTITAEDGKTQQKYVTNYVITSADASLKSISIDGTEMTNFDAQTYSYEFNVQALPSTVVATLSDEEAVLESSTETLDDGIKYIFKVTAADKKTSCTYTVTFRIAQASSDATLSSITIDGKLLDGFSSSQYEYNITLNEWPEEVKATPTDPAATVVSDVHEIKNVKDLRVYDFEVTAADGVTTLTYEVIVKREELSDDATLSLISIDDGESAIDGFQPSVYSYTLHVDALVDHALVYAETNSPKAILATPQWSTIENGEKVTFVVTAEDGKTQQTYEVTFLLPVQELSHDATLARLEVENQVITLFTTGEVTLVDVQSLDKSTIVAVPTDSKTSVAYSWDTGYENLLEVTITAEDGTTTQNYFFQFVLPQEPEKSHDATLASITLVGVETISKPEAGLLYEFTVQAVPQVQYLVNDAKATASVQWSEDGLSVSIVVTAEDGETQLTYLLKFTIYQEPEKSHDATLAYITIDGEKYTDFNPSITRVIDLAAVPSEDEVTIVPTDANATYTLQQDDVFFILTITAEDGTTQLTYLFVINIVSLSDDNTLANIALDGITLPDFSPNVTDYEQTLYSLPVVSATPNSDKATMQIVQPTEANPVATISVTAENGDVRVYTINITLIVEPASSLIPLEVEFANGFKGFIDAVNMKIDVYYLSTEAAPAAIRSWQAQDGETLESVALTSDDVLTVRSGSGVAEYKVNYIPVQFGALTTDNVYTFTGEEDYIKTSYFYTDSRGWRLSKDLEEPTNRRISRGKDRLYFFLPGCAAIRLQTTTASRSVRIALNGEDITESQKNFDKQNGIFYTASQGGVTYINALTKNEPMMLEIEAFNSTGDAAFSAMTLLAEEEIENAVENVMQNVVYADGIIYNPDALPLQVYSITGQLVAAGQGNIDINALPKAVYVVRCNDMTMKLIKL